MPTGYGQQNEDEDMARAIAASMGQPVQPGGQNQNNNANQFGGNQLSEDEQLARALAESMNQ